MVKIFPIEIIAHSSTMKLQMILAAVVHILKALLDRDNITRIPSLYPSFPYDYLLRVNMDSAKFLHGSSNEGSFGEEQQVRVQKALLEVCVFKSKSKDNTQTIYLLTLSSGLVKKF